MNPACIVLSPGPGRPEDAGVCTEVVDKLAKEIPILGVCLGHQAICQAFGGKVTYARQLMHGKTSSIELDCSSRLFQGLEKSIPAARYHSLAVEEESLPDVLRVKPGGRQTEKSWL